jgi:hypothetical protein
VVLTDLGLSLGGWVLTEGRGISANGQVIVGTGINPQGVFEAWRVDLGSAVILGDMNCDSIVDLFDLDPFALALVDPAGYASSFPNCNIDNADINGDDATDGLDIQGFVQLLTAP